MYSDRKTEIKYQVNDMEKNYPTCYHENEDKMLIESHTVIVVVFIVVSIVDLFDFCKRNFKYN